MGVSKKKITPAGYPESSFKESDSVQCLQSLMKNKYIKPHINVDDKIPNHDGHIEILDHNRIPKGRVTVQIKTIPEGRMQYSCNMKYVSYSETISEPFLLICVDVSNNKAYWRHIESVMPEIKEGQAFFTIYFSDADAIDNTDNYIKQWQQICDNYKKSIECYQTSKSISYKNNNIKLEHHIQDYEGIVKFDYSNNNGIYAIGKGEYSFDTKWTGASKTAIHTYSDGKNICCIGFNKEITFFPESIKLFESFDYSSRVRTVHVGEIFAMQNISNRFAIIRVETIKNRGRGDDIDEVCFKYKIYMEQKYGN